MVCGLALALLAVAVPQASAGQLLSAKVGSAAAKAVRCHEEIRSGRGIVHRRVTMPASGLVQARLNASRGDWDLAVFDRASGALVGGSSGFNSLELAEGFAAGGRGLLVQACRVSGRSRAARVTVTTVPFPRSESERPIAQLVRVHTPTRPDKARLDRLGLDLTEHAGHDFVAAVLYGPADVARLRRGGFTWDVVIPDLDRRARADARRNARYAAAVNASALPSGRDSYRRLADYEADMKKLAADHPGLVKELTLPLRSIEGRQVFGIEVSDDVHATDGKPVLLMLGLHHAREWPSGEHTIEFAHELVRGYGTDERITDLLRRARVVFVPVVNPDGFNVSREAAADLGEAGKQLGEALDGGSTGYAVVSLADPFVAYKRRNCRIVAPLPSPPGACALPAFRFTGVDLNRNYGALWGGAGASALPLYDTYRGTGPFSEPETQNIRRLVSTRQVTTLITNHTFSNLVLRPPGVQAQGLAPDEEALKDLGDRMAAENGYVSQPAYGLYDTTGTTEDWSYNATGGFGYTFEIGPDDFHPPFPEVVAEYEGHGPHAGKGNRSAYLLALENAANPATHSVLRGRAPAGAVLRLRKTFMTDTSPVRPLEAHVVEGLGEVALERLSFRDTLDTTLVVGGTNRFEWHVNPSTRPAVQDRRHPGEPLVVRSETFRNAPGEQSMPAQSHFDREFTVTAEDNADELQVDLEWPTPDDYDLEVYLKQADGQLEHVGGSGNAPGSAEHATIVEPTLVPGTYVLRVVNFAAVGQEWTMTAAVRRAGEIRTVPGSGPESWTLTCSGSDGTVLATREVFVARGETVALGQACAPGALAPFSLAERRARAVRIARRAVRLTRRGRAPVILRCPRAAAPEGCAGTLRLSLLRRRAVVAGRARYSIRPGRSAVVRVRVGRRVRRLLAGRRELRLTALAIPRGRDAIRSRAVFRLLGPRR